MARLGVELGKRTIRGVRVDGWPTRRTRAVEIEWDLDAPEEAVLALRELGPVRSIAIAVDLPLLLTTRITLPAVAAAARRDILRLEAERYFAVRSEDLVPAVRQDDDLVFAVREGQLAAWVAALERIAPVDLVEPAPVTLGRGLARAAITQAVVVCDRRADGIGVVELSGGVVTRARRLFGDLASVPAALAPRGAAASPPYFTPWDADRSRALSALVGPLQPLPAVANLADGFVAAYGAALGLDATPDFAHTLVSPQLGGRIRRRHRRALGLAIAACGAALIFALGSADARSARAARQLDGALAALRAQAAPAVALQTELATLAQRADAIRQIASERPDPLRVLQALSRQLPAGAFVRGIHGAASEWQVDGYAPNAARVLAALGADPQFRDLHFLSAMNRAQFGRELYETFALAFRFVPAS
ncbi:MAG TPA: PilN domain-containing protein [Gemmatimonadales bacterium]|nr:PilN domain-containing protein [Gemmatimonadales bacterium]